MKIDEVEVYVTSDGLGRAGIVRRLDGLFCIYMKWKWPDDGRSGGLLMFPADYVDNWFDDHTPPSVLYFGSHDQEPDQDPEPGVYGTIDDARRNLRAYREFGDAVLKSTVKVT